jgi:hypothetical protein
MGKCKLKMHANEDEHGIEEILMNRMNVERKL